MRPQVTLYPYRNFRARSPPLNSICWAPICDMQGSSGRVLHLSGGPKNFISFGVNVIVEMLSRTSRVSGFYKLNPRERLKYVKKFANLSSDEAEILQSTGALKLEQADRMIENVVGAISVPLGIAINFIVNGKEYLVPMATEQRSIITAASKGAEWTQATGGFKASSMGSTMIGQVQLTGVDDPEKARQRILSHKREILSVANTQSRVRKATDVEVRTLETAVGPMFIVELLVDTKDSMGANVVNAMAEAVAPLVESLTGGKVNLRMVSNLASRRLVRVRTVVAKENVGGLDIVDRIVEASVFAEADPFRAATHNKGVMNGVSAVLLATGNDTRAVEAGAHAFASVSGRYLPFTAWRKNEEGNLFGFLEMPMVVGTVGGVVSVHPTAKIALKILGVKTAVELGEVAASAGLAYNLAALQALVTQGVERL